SEELAEPPDVKITGQLALVTATGPLTYEAVYTMRNDDLDGLIPYSIDFVDLAVNPGVQVSGAEISFDQIPPAAAGLTADVTTPTNGHVHVTISFPADASVQEYSMNESGPW